MTEDNFHTAVDEMRRIGGSFVKSLAEAWSHADSLNRSILQMIFFEKYFRPYYKSATGEKELPKKDTRWNMYVKIIHTGKEDRPGFISLTKAGKIMKDTSKACEKNDCKAVAPM